MESNDEHRVRLFANLDTASRAIANIRQSFRHCGGAHGNTTAVHSIAECRAAIDAVEKALQGEPSQPAATTPSAASPAAPSPAEISATNQALSASVEQKLGAEGAEQFRAFSKSLIKGAVTVEQFIRKCRKETVFGPQLTNVLLPKMARVLAGSKPAISAQLLAALGLPSQTNPPDWSFPRRTKVDGHNAAGVDPFYLEDLDQLPAELTLR